MLPAFADTPHLVSFGEADPFQKGRLSRWNIKNLGVAGLADAPAQVAPPPATQRSVGGNDDSDDDCDQSPIVTRLGNVVYLDFPETCRFKIDLAARAITIFAVKATALGADLSHLLNDHVAPRILAESGALVLHGSTVEIGGALVLFLGETGVGKSTLAASFEGHGGRLLGDDAVIVGRDVTDAFMGEPVYPSLRLFPESINAVIGEGVSTAQMAGYSDKRHVKLADLTARSGSSAPIAALFFLEGDIGAPAPAVRPASKTTACIALVEQSFSLDPADHACAARRLAACAALVQAVPSFALSYPHDFDRLSEVHDVIQQTLAKLGSASNQSTSA